MPVQISMEVILYKHYVEHTKSQLKQNISEGF